jgi:hypothetical protein
MGAGTSFPELELLKCVMVDRPDKTNIKLSQARERMALVRTILRKWYLNEVGGQGPRPHWRGGDVVEPVAPI